jgi:hypothetical protein
VDDDNSLIFYLLNQNSDALVGAGMAQVQLSNGSPTVVKCHGENGWWWNATHEPRYGDVAAYRDDNSEYIHGWGGAPTSSSGYVSGQYVYQIRVLARAAWDKRQHEYWWGRNSGWKQNTPFTTFNKETAVMWGVGQGGAYYSPYYEWYFYVNFNNSDSVSIPTSLLPVILNTDQLSVAIRTAPAPEGPRSDDVKVYTLTPINGGFTYAPECIPTSILLAHYILHKKKPYPSD